MIFKVQTVGTLGHDGCLLFLINGTKKTYSCLYLLMGVEVCPQAFNNKIGTMDLVSPTPTTKIRIKSNN